MAKTVRLLNVNEIQNSSGNTVIPNMAVIQIMQMMDTLLVLGIRTFHIIQMVFQ